MLAVLDWFLTFAHVAVILGFLLLWIPRRTVRLHRWLVALTALSWLGLGLFHGLGYCFLTDWHFQVKHARGVRRLPHSFIKYAGDWITGRDLPAGTVDAVAGAVFVAGVLVAVFRYVEELRKNAK